MKCHSSCQRVGSHGTAATVQQPCLKLFPCDSHEPRVCVWVPERACACVWVTVVSYSNKNQEQSQEQRCHSAFFCSFSLLLCRVPVPHRKLLTLWQSRYNSSSRTLRYSFCDSYERCVCLCLCIVRIMWQCHPVHNEGQFHPTFPLNFKSIRVVQQQRYNSSSGTTPPANLATLVIHRNTRVLPFQLTTQPGFQVNHIQKRNLVCTWYWYELCACASLQAIIPGDKADSSMRKRKTTWNATASTHFTSQ